MINKSNEMYLILEKIEKLNDLLFGTDVENGPLKDFQRYTVERIDNLFQNGQNRILVADEVGLGKTWIAKGAIAKVAKMCVNSKKKSFKVIYVCSNQSIAKQNIKTLDVFDTHPQVDDARLTMQHLNVMRFENDENASKHFMQLIPLTPGTSFDIEGGGEANERALLFALLCRVRKFKSHKKALSRLLMLSCGLTSWKKCVKKKLTELKDVVDKSKRRHVNSSCIYKQNYPENILKKLGEETITLNSQSYSLFSTISLVIKIIEKQKCKTKKCSSCEQKEKCCRGQIVRSLRNAVAKIGVEMLMPDFVIMDEFQRFNKLIKSSDDAEGFLAKQFLKQYNEDESVRTRVLLLSATPYKLYSTIEELNSNKDENPYNEFLYVMDFLFDKTKADFKLSWDAYSKSLKDSVDNSLENLVLKKREVEQKMYNGICRTERISVMDGEKIIRVVGVNREEHLHPTELDVRSYIQAQSLMNDCEIIRKVPVDYIKSCPFLMSYMENYVLKKDILNAFRVNNSLKIDTANKSLLWLTKSQIEKYDEIPDANARLHMLKDHIFKNNSELLLWCPPTRPYYILSGAFENVCSFSKILVFSAWEMVPKMISTLVSYESERLVRKKYKSNPNYFSYKRTGLLKYDVSKPEGKQLFSELYPSDYLSKKYNPIDFLNLPIEDVKRILRNKIQPDLEKQKKYEGDGEDNDWYIAALLFLDDDNYVDAWLKEFEDSISAKKSFVEEIVDDELDDEIFDEDESDEDSAVKEKAETDVLLRRTIQYVKKIRDKTISLGKQPEKLLDFLVNVCLSSFATCFYRSFGKDSNKLKASEFGRVFVRNFNTPEVMAILEAVYKGNQKQASSNYLDKVYNYCIDGCFQGMLDEYVHLLNENNKINCQDDVVLNLDMLTPARYLIDTFDAFKSDVQNANGREKRFVMRSHFASCFSKSTGKSKGDRKESLRTAFNTPLRPFVLATTSIGQEGLDFHNYCRKIMHWNLPSNPVDLEQREGRINRYKCLAIRQNVALRHGSMKFNNSVSLWDQMFERAKKIENGGKFSELVPFWVFGKNQEIKIERLIPVYPFSSDEDRYERLIKILSLYRLTMGQANQEDLLDYVFSKCDKTKIEQLKKMFIDLSPYSHEKRLL